MAIKVHADKYSDVNVKSKIILLIVVNLLNNKSYKYKLPFGQLPWKIPGPTPGVPVQGKDCKFPH